MSGCSETSSTFQLLNICPVRSLLNSGTQHRVDLSDGIHIQKALLPSKFSQLVADKTLKEGTIIQLQKTVCRMVDHE
ncbi:hypothetical protein KI387_040250, partial [Taxus chinensis]